MNTSNGALIAKCHNRLYVCDLENYQGTYMLTEDGNIIGRINGVMWFATPYGGHIYYSNQKDNDYLYCLNTETLAERCILPRACGNITVFDDKLFFLDETDSFIYKFDPQTARAVAVTKEKVFSFIPGAGLLYCSFAKGLLEFDLRSGKSTILTDHIPVCLNLTSIGLIFADSFQDFALSVLNPGQNKPVRMNNIKTQSIVAGESHIYAANLLDNNSIIRVDMDGGEAIRFCGEKADKLHIIDNTLYFQNQNEKNAWHKMPLSGGRSTRLIPPLG